MARSFTFSFFFFFIFKSQYTTVVFSQNTTQQRFKEAPKFYNSPTCNTLQHHPNDTCPRNAVHVAMTLDVAYIRGSMAAILSVLQHSSCPENVIFHFLSAASKPSSFTTLNQTLTNSFPYLNFQIYPFDDIAVSRLISTSIRSALDTPLNYARSYLADLLPHCVVRVVYLDSDLILVDDIAKLASTPLSDTEVLAAPEYCSANFSTYFTPSFWANPSLSLSFSNRKRPCYFNTGVMVIDLQRWRAGDYTTVIEEWMELQKRPEGLRRWIAVGISTDSAGTIFVGFAGNCIPGPLILLPIVALHRHCSPPPLPSTAAALHHRCSPPPLLSTTAALHHRCSPPPLLSTVVALPPLPSTTAVLHHRCPLPPFSPPPLPSTTLHQPLQDGVENLCRKVAIGVGTGIVKVGGGDEFAEDQGDTLGEESLEEGSGRFQIGEGVLEAVFKVTKVPGSGADFDVHDGGFGVGGDKVLEEKVGVGAGAVGGGDDGGAVEC
ncbi:hypothetical protein LR48_Vigan01g188100 [Vigna angularis]|uniref:Hexosyltransferase n=1 Tax=Phaseolus angularis TaxID=3914 RepID=A0A0L9TP47_PHAAN|nr:hypothetical protein LR48_Vigan01g188100 [Vigna angularis]